MTTHTTTSSSETQTRGLSFSSLDREDMALLGWLGGIVHRDISSYSMYERERECVWILLTLYTYVLLGYMMERYCVTLLMK